MRIHVLVSCLSIFSNFCFSQTCTDWKSITKIHDLGSELREASGLALATMEPGSYYHIEDSGSKPTVSISDANGRIERVAIKGASFVDAEDLAIAKCGNQNCLVIADIGDNKLERKTVDFIFIEESKLKKNTTIDPLFIVKAKYPDGPQNAEAAAVHPNGDLYVFTKIQGKKSDPIKTKVYRLRSDTKQVATPSKVHTFDYVTTLEVDNSGYKLKKKGKHLTSADISKSGEKIIFLTSHFAFEIELDLSKIKEKRTNVALHPIILPIQPQQEAVSYNSSGTGFLLSSEQESEKISIGKIGTRASLVEVNCN